MCRRISARLIEILVFSGVGEKYFVGCSLISAAKAGFEGTAVSAAVNRCATQNHNKAVIAAVNRCATQNQNETVIAAVKRVGEDSVVPPGLRSFSLLFPALKSVRENWVVPPGLRSFFPLFPALKRWAKFGRPSGAGFSLLTAAVDRFGSGAPGISDCPYFARGRTNASAPTWELL